MSDASNEALRLAAEAEEAPEVPQDAGAFLLWVADKAEAVRDEEALLEQDEAAERLRRQRVAEHMQKRLNRIAALQAELRRGCEAMRHVLLPGKAKSRVLPGGLRVAFRRRPERLVVRDEVALLRWADGYGDVLVRKVPDMAAVRERFKKTGEVPDGAEVVGGDEAFTVAAEAAEE